MSLVFMQSQFIRAVSLWFLGQTQFPNEMYAMPGGSKGRRERPFNLSVHCLAC